MLTVVVSIRIKKEFKVHFVKVCIRRDLHLEFHKKYGFGNNTPQQYQEFKNGIPQINLKEPLL